MLHLRRPALLADPPVAVAKLAVAVAQLEVPSGVGLDLVAPIIIILILISQFLRGNSLFPLDVPVVLLVSRPRRRQRLSTCSSFGGEAPPTASAVPRESND